MVDQQNDNSNSDQYICRLAPSPTGLIHVGHLQTFFTAYNRSKSKNGKLIFRVEDLDFKRCKTEYLYDMIYDLNWFGINWDEGPNLTNYSKESHKKHFQSMRMPLYIESWKKLLDKGVIYPCPYSRKDVERALSAPNEGDEEIIYPINLRPTYMKNLYNYNSDESIRNIFKCCINDSIPVDIKSLNYPTPINWRFRVPDEVTVSFQDNRCGLQQFVAGKDFGDFLIWRSDGYPSYELAVVVDDADMHISEVVRGEDLLLSTARQILLYIALDLSNSIPAFYHCKLVRDSNGKRLSKRDNDTSVKCLRENHHLSPMDIINHHFNL